MPSPYSFPVLLSPLGVLYYLHGASAKKDFLSAHRTTAINSHNYDVLVGTPATSNLKEGRQKSHMGGWQLFGNETWLQSDNGDLIYHFSGVDPSDMKSPDIKSYMATVARLRTDAAFCDAKKLAECVRGGQRANGKAKLMQTAVAKVGTGVDAFNVTWMKVERPVDAEARIHSGRGARRICRSCLLEKPRADVVYA
jgi:hypothetical protein